jgi:outer membrane protein TolC
MALDGTLAALVPGAMHALLVALLLAAIPPGSVPLDADPVVVGLVAEAQRNGPDIGRAEAAARAEGDRAPQVSSLPDPTLTLGIQNDGFDGIQIGTMETSYWQVMLTQPVPWPGKLSARAAAASAQAGVASGEVARLRLSTTAEVERAYVDLLVVRGQLALLARLEVLWGEAEVMARTRYEVGQGAQSDLLRAQLERTRLKQRRVALEGEERTRVQVLNRLRVRPLEEPIPTPLPLSAFSDPVLRAADEAITDAERRSPDLALAGLSVVAADRRVDAARREWFPDFAVTAGVMPRGKIEPMWTVQLGITLPVWGATKQSRGVDESLSRREADLRGEESVRLLVKLRAAERRTLLAAALQTLEVYRGGILVQSDATVRSTLAQYQVGKVTFPSVLEVLRGLVVDEGGYLDALATAQRLAIADREVSLAPPDSIGSGSGGPVPGAASVSTAGRPAGGSPQPAAVPAATGSMSSGM